MLRAFVKSEMFCSLLERLSASTVHLFVSLIVEFAFFASIFTLLLGNRNIKGLMDGFVPLEP